MFAFHFRSTSTGSANVAVNSRGRSVPVMAEAANAFETTADVLYPGIGASDGAVVSISEEQPASNAVVINEKYLGRQVFGVWIQLFITTKIMILRSSFAGWLNPFNLPANARSTHADRALRLSTNSFYSEIK